jgi:hypothetical protein
MIEQHVIHHLSRHRNDTVHNKTKQRVFPRDCERNAVD